MFTCYVSWLVRRDEFMSELMGGGLFRHACRNSTTERATTLPHLVVFVMRAVVFFLLTK